MNEAAKILLVDDEPDILEFLSYNLEKEGMRVFKAENGEAAILLAREIRPDIVVLDIQMPVMDGIQACKELRSDSDFNSTLIVFLTAREEDYIQIEGLVSGADDYVNKPIKPQLFVSKIKALLRRGIFEDSRHVFGQRIQLDLDKYIVIADGEELYLPRKEFELLKMLISKPGKVFKRPEILSQIWGEDVYVTDRTIDVHIRKLREKIGEGFIQTVKGVGYKFIQ